MTKRRYTTHMAPFIVNIYGVLYGAKGWECVEISRMFMFWLC